MELTSSEFFGADVCSVPHTVLVGSWEESGDMGMIHGSVTDHLYSLRRSASMSLSFLICLMGLMALLHLSFT